MTISKKVTLRRQNIHAAKQRRYAAIPNSLMMVGAFVTRCRVVMRPCMLPLPARRASLIPMQQPGQSPRLR